MVDELCNARDIEYKAYVRNYPESIQVLFVVATCWYSSYGSLTDVYFQAEEGTWEGWQLRQRAPDGMPLLNSYHVASGIRREAIPTQPLPAQITITDAHGQRTVPVEAW